ncbi:MAG TPA: NUDIX domain-containing protein [Ktedonobacteraceae bacterium]|nr:NUDIX domain-containing protein [Ktedonobacteraceae bacterium]
MFYDWLKLSVCLFFNLLNKLTGNKLPPFGCACALVEQDGLYLVVELPRKRVVFPGGFMTWKERPAQTAEREGREETGLQLRAGELVTVYATPSPRLTRMSTICFVYTARVIGGELHKTTEGRPSWLNESELRRQLTPEYLQMFDDYLHWRQQSTTASQP